MRGLLGTLAAVLALTASSIDGAKATELLFTIEGPYPTVIFELPSSPTPYSVTPGSDFYFFATPATVGGTAATLNALTFYNQNFTTYNIEYTVNGGDTFLYGGSQIYTGSEANPMFSPGSFTLFGVNHFPDTETLTISEVPELSTWAMMLLGFAGMGCAGFRSARARRSATA
jgi:hypothetical protein